MSRSIAVQTLGSVSVLGCVIASEAAASLLSWCPASQVAWFLNLEVFAAFQHARVASSPIQSLFGPPTIWIASGILLVTLVAGVRRWRLTTATITNLSFIVAACLGFTGLQAGTVIHETSLLPIAVPDRFDVWLTGWLVVISAIAAALSHLSFFMTIRAERVAAPS